ncbi:hypothetical protein ABDK56_13050 [Sphingomonas sp. ASV193]|uniref:SMP-30/gluconolactonase/LRE family protein n=1 Tax=Sphingomonas sp. ASV193 TaxID=3144405 RepID=UPI0032E89880
MMTILTILELVLSILLFFCAASLAFPRISLRGLLGHLPKSAIVRFSSAAFVALAAVLMLAASAIPFLAFFAASLSLAALALLHLVARFATARLGLPIALALAAGSLAVAGLQPLGLKVLLLPKAAALPIQRAPSRTVKVYEAGVWFEGIAAGADGTLFLSANRGLDFSDLKYYRRASGEVIARSPDGSERSIFRTPVGATAGVIAVGPDGALFLTSNGDEPGIWRIGANGDARKITRLPKGAWPNGLDFGPDGMLYTPDSNLARVWRINPKTGAAAIALQDRRLAARPFISLAPGANGLHFSGQDMIVTVSDSTEVIRYRLAKDGTFGPAVVIARGIPGDDFAVGHDGSLFITTHPYNTLVRVTPGGERTIIADAEQNIVGATDAVFGRGAGDRETLYVVTDGGAFTGGPSTRGALVAVQPYAH